MAGNALARSETADYRAARSALRVGLDARMVSLARHGGIARYIRSLVSEMAKLDGAPSYHFLSYPDASWPEEIYARAPKSFTKAKVYSLAGELSLPRQLRRMVCDLFHAPHYTVPLLAPDPVVVTVHDLIHIRYPRTMLVRLYASLVLACAVHKASRIIVVSESTSRDLSAMFPGSAAKTTVIPNGCEPCFRPQLEASIAALRHVFPALPDRFVLYVGATRHYKNVPALVEAFAALRRRSDLGPLKLVLAAKRSDLADPRIATGIARLGLAEEVVFLDFVPEEHLPALYAAASVFVYPSLYEGFGFPPLEAMACGTPVVCSRASSLPEVVGDAGLLVDSTCPGEMCAALERALADAELRRTLVARGLRRAAVFSWQETAKRTLAVYEQAVGGKL